MFWPSWMKIGPKATSVKHDMTWSRIAVLIGIETWPMPLSTCVIGKIPFNVGPIIHTKAANPGLDKHI